MKFSKAGLLLMPLVLIIIAGTSVVAQSKSMTAAEQKNLTMVLDWWREVIQSRHAELVSKYAAEDLIQHNPNFPQGRAAIVTMLSSRPPVNPIPAEIAEQPAAAFAKGDYVVLVWEREEKDPTNAAKTYKYNPFDAFRIQNGKIQEHWDAAKRNPPPAQPAP